MKLLLYCQNRISVLGFQQIFNQEPACQVIPAYWLEETLELARLLQPDLIVLDMDSSVELTLLRNLRQLLPAARMVLWVGSISPEMVLQSVNLGVVGIIPKTSEPQDFLRRIWEVHSGGTSIERYLMNGISSHRGVHLSRRESELVALIAQGLRNKEIAARLNITENTVKAYLSRLFEKVKVDDRLGLALYGLSTFSNDIHALRTKVGVRAESEVVALHAAS